MRPWRQRDWKVTASSGVWKTRTGSRGCREMKAERRVGGDMMGERLRGY
jgi:hypothetical protein